MWDENLSFTYLSFCQCKTELLKDFKIKQNKTKQKTEA